MWDKKLKILSLFSLIAFSPISSAFAGDVLSCGHVGLAGGDKRIVNVANAAQFKKAIGALKAGDTLRLAPGNYGALTLNNVKMSGKVTIESANPARPAVLGRTLLTNVNNLSFENLKFSWSAPAQLISPPGIMEVKQSSNVHVLNSEFVGGTAPKGSLIKVNDGAKNDTYTVNMSGLGTGTGMIAVSVSNLQVRNSSFDNLTIGTNFNFLTNSKLVANTYSDIAYDAIDLGGVKNMVVEGNWVKSMAYTPNLGHRDLIQLRAFGDATDTLVIKNNVMVSSVAGDVHGIYMGNAKAKAGGGTNTYYKNIYIAGNTLVMRQMLGIAVGHTIGLKIINNNVLQVSGVNPSKVGNLPKIVAGINSSKVVVTGNKSHDVRPGNDKGNWEKLAKPSAWVMTSNTTAATSARMSPPKLSKAPGCGK